MISCRYLYARDVLVMPASMVASKSAFSIGGRALDSFKTSSNSNVINLNSIFLSFFVSYYNF